MGYVKDTFLRYAYAVCADCPDWKLDTDKCWKNAISSIMQRYEQDPGLAQYMICQTVYDFASCATVSDRVVRGKWQQLFGILELYRDSRITDIGISAHIARNTLGKRGLPASGVSMFIHDRGDSRFHIETKDPELRKVAENDLETIDPNQSRWEYFKSIEQAFRSRNTEKIEYAVELATYLFLDGQADESLLERSPNSFVEEDVHSDMDIHPHEYQYIQSLISKLSMNQLKHLSVYCGLKTDEEIQSLVNNDELTNESGEPLIRETVEHDIWYADREDFYREYAYLLSESAQRRV